MAYSPVPDETAPRGIGGVLATVHEITEKVIGERRVVILRDLGARAGAAKTAEAACAAAAATLAPHARDIPFALLYLIDPDGRAARLAGAAGIAPGTEASPEVVALDAPEAASAWPLAQVMRSGAAMVVDDLAARFAQLPRGPWPDPPRAAVLVPVRANKAEELAALLVAGVSPRLRLDELYRSFLDLVAAQIATSIANARAHEEERRRAEALAEIDYAKTVFFSNVSHEFRTPLTLMLGPLEEILAAPAALSPERRADLALVHRNGLRLLRLVNTLLDFARIEAGRVQASYEPIDLAASTAELASVFRAATERAGLTLTVDCPPLGEPVWVDRDMWEKIVLNLISNALKFTLVGGITLRLRRAGGAAVLAVADTGTGIPAPELPLLFDRFHRVDGARGRTHEGTGIGLALVQELAKLHGGTVRVESVLGEGSTFTVTIPLGTAHLPAERLHGERRLASTALGAQPYLEEALRWLGAGADESVLEGELLPERPAPAESAGERATILLADDSADMRDYLGRLLSPAYEVRMVGDGAAALAALRERRPDLLVSDVMMPRLDGIALVRAIRADPALADLPVILLSARAGEEASIAGLEVGADDYLIKPFSARELLARIAANLKLTRLRREFEERARAQEVEIAARQQVEAALQQAQRLEAVGQLTGGIAHDFNNLLTVIMAQTEAIALAAPGNENIARMADMVLRAAERAAQLTDQLLSFSGRQQLRPVTLAADKLIRNVGGLARRLVGETIAVEIEVDARLWPAYIDPAQFESAILNLAINARDAMPQGGSLLIKGRNARIAGEAARRLGLKPGAYIVASVRDSGIGMSAETQRRAFEPFYTTKDIGKGTGLGLSQIYGFARQSGGTATIDSAPGAGTTVSLYLPRATAAVEEASSPAPHAPRAGKGKTILLVEDQADVRDVMENALAGLGYRVLTASDGVAARQVLRREEAIDLLLTDAVMPHGVSGLDLAREARALRRDLGIVVVSGYLREALDRGRELADVVFLEKPFLLSQLADTVAAALARAPSRGQDAGLGLAVAGGDADP